MIAKEPASRASHVRVTFSLPPGLWVAEAYLVGDFNDWGRGSLPLDRSVHNGWRITLELERGRSYQYRYLLDGRWCNDCNADRYVPGPFGEHNSVVDT